MEPEGGGNDHFLPPITDSGEGSIFIQLNRNKRSVEYNPKSDQSRTAIRKPIQTADVVLVNVPESALVKIGIDYDTLKSIRNANLPSSAHPVRIDTFTNTGVA